MSEKQVKTINNRKDIDVLALREAESWVFDLDNTLYPASANMFDEIDRRMCAFIADFLEMDAAAAYRLQKSYFREHGTTLRGLMENHGMDPGPYLDFVHDISVDGVAPDPRLGRALDALPGRKVVFTNASKAHAERVISRLGIAGRFDGIFDIAEAGYVPKPDRGVYDKLVAAFGIEPRRAVMVEDVARNLGPAAALGMTTVWVATDRPWAQADAEDIAPDHTVDDLSRWLAELTGTGGH